jgi:hypothetical protein
MHPTIQYQLAQGHVAELHRQAARVRAVRTATHSRRSPAESSRQWPRTVTTLAQRMFRLLPHRAAAR